PWSVFLILAAWYGGWSAVARPWPRFHRFWRGAAENEADVREAGIRGADFPSTVCGRIENPPHEDRRSDPLNATCDAYRFLWSWFVVYFAFYSLSATKLPNYVLPAIMPLGILLARFAQRWRDGTIRPPAVTLHLSLGSLVFIGLVLALGLGILAGIVE